MVDLGSLAARLADATDVSSATERLAEHLLELVPDAAVRVYLLGAADRCTTCARAPDCGARDVCLHLEAGLGTFARPPGSVERIPRTDERWAAAAAGQAPAGPIRPPGELEATPPEDGTIEAGTPEAATLEAAKIDALLLPMVAAGETIGVVGIRTPAPLTAEREAQVRTATLLGATACRLLLSLQNEGERYRQLLLVNELGHKVNSILDDALLLKQAALDIRRTFGFHNVMIFMRDAEREDHLVLRAQASNGTAAAPTAHAVGLEQGIVGRACRRRETEIVSDVRDDPDFVAWFPDTRAEIAVPIQIGGVVEGVLNVESDRVDGFGESERLVLETIANQLATALENARLFKMVKERENRYRVLVEWNPGAVVHLDDKGCVIFANRAAAELTGQPKEDLLAAGMPLHQFAAAESRDVLREAIADALHGTPRQDVEFHIEHGDGSVRIAQASLQPLISESGATRGVVVLARDRTRERELQDRLYQSEKLSAIGGLVSGVAHELNNPLAGILGFAQLLLTRPESEWARKDIEKIEKNAHRCQSIVENLLAFARQARLSRRLTNLNEIIESVLRLNEYQFHVDDIEVQRDFDLRIPTLHLDVNRWQQVFVNLALNAHQAMAAAPAEHHVLRFETRLKDDHVQIRVADTGPGIPPEMRARVFEPFFTTKESGTGLGLGICYGIVTEHGGTIALEPATEGTSFLITLPIQPAPDDAPPRPDPARKARSISGEGRRVLVIDDEDYVREVVAQALEKHRYTVDAVEDGLSALERIRASHYDAVLCDVSMPGPYKGIELYDRVEAERPDMAARFIFLTGHLHDDALTAQIKARTGRCVEKPFDIHRLAEAVHDVAVGATQGGAPAADGA